MSAQSLAFTAVVTETSETVLKAAGVVAGTGQAVTSTVGTWTERDFARSETRRAAAKEQESGRQ